jgi:hypothetical protein
VSGEEVDDTDVPQSVDHGEDIFKGTHDLPTYCSGRLGQIGRKKRN